MGYSWGVITAMRRAFATAADLSPSINDLVNALAATAGTVDESAAEATAPPGDSTVDAGHRRASEIPDWIVPVLDIASRAAVAEDADYVSIRYVAGAVLRLYEPELGQQAVEQLEALTEGAADKPWTGPRITGETLSMKSNEVRQVLRRVAIAQ